LENHSKKKAAPHNGKKPHEMTNEELLEVAFHILKGSIAFIYPNNISDSTWKGTIYSAKNTYEVNFKQNRKDEFIGRHTKYNKSTVRKSEEISEIVGHKERYCGFECTFCGGVLIFLG
jgi:hypothetical protein